MGNVCCGAAEHKKVGAFQGGGDDSDDRDRQYDSHHSFHTNATAPSYQQTSNIGGSAGSQTTLASGQGSAEFMNMNNAGTNSNSSMSNLHNSAISAAEQAKENERLQALREEQARLELIVQATGRGMVAVRSTRGSTGYYDQGFAAALAQHLEQTTQFPATLPISLPVVHPTDSIYARLAQPQWEGIALGTKGGGLAGCAGENPNTYMNHVAESYLDATIPKKERLFRGIGPIVENLL
jgi:hypothetical protein